MYIDVFKLLQAELLFSLTPVKPVEWYTIIYYRNKWHN